MRKSTINKLFIQFDRVGYLIKKIIIKLRVQSVGKDIKLYGMPRLISPDNIEIGQNVNINKGVVLGGYGGVKIGNNVTLSQSVVIESAYLDIKNPGQKIHKGKLVVIEDDVWIATGAIILPGVTIGRGSVISAGVVVNKNIPPNMLVKNKNFEMEKIRKLD